MCFSSYNKSNRSDVRKKLSLPCDRTIETCVDNQTGIKSTAKLDVFSKQTKNCLSHPWNGDLEKPDFFYKLGKDVSPREKSVVQNSSVISEYDAVCCDGRPRKRIYVLSFFLFQIS